MKVNDPLELADRLLVWMRKEYLHKPIGAPLFGVESIRYTPERLREWAWNIWTNNVVLIFLFGRSMCGGWSLLFRHMCETCCLEVRTVCVTGHQLVEVKDSEDNWILYDPSLYIRYDCSIDELIQDADNSRTHVVDDFSYLTGEEHLRPLTENNTWHEHGWDLYISPSFWKGKEWNVHPNWKGDHRDDTVLGEIPLPEPEETE